jgi:hypothetical protein
MAHIFESIGRPERERQSAINEEVTAARKTLAERSASAHREGWTYTELIRELAPADGKTWDGSLANIGDIDHLTLVVLRRLLHADPSNDFMVLAFLVHLAIMRNVPLCHRRIDSVWLKNVSSADNTATTVFLSSFASHMADIFRDLNWNSPDPSLFVGRAADMLDGRLLRACVHVLRHHTAPVRFSPPLHAHLRRYIELVDTADIVRNLTKQHGLEAPAPPPARTEVIPHAEPSAPDVAVLPFNSPEFDEHLAPIKLAVNVTFPGAYGGGQPYGMPAKLFEELSHWHNTKRPVDPKAVSLQAAKKTRWQLRAEQRWLRDMAAYAASMTNSVGRALEPEPIVVSRSAKDASTPPPRGSLPAPELKSPAAATETPTKKKGKGVPKGRNTIREEIAARKALKDEEDASKIVDAWKVKRTSIEAVADLMTRYASAQAYLQNLPSVKRRVLHAEILLYQLQVLMALWAGYCKTGKKDDGCPAAALACYVLLQLAECPSGMSQAIATEVGRIALSLGVPIHRFAPRKNAGTRFSFDQIAAEASRKTKKPQPQTSTAQLLLPMEWTEFQLTHYGPYMERDFDSAPDPRVSFEPDGWQRQVLDELDADNSVFVVAPTSAGKTFISFYAMEKVLRESDDGVLVYVAPTKALVSQIAAEIQARFRKTYLHPGKCMWAIHTRDYRCVFFWCLVQSRSDGSSQRH